MRGTPKGLIFHRCIYRHLVWLTEKWPNGYITAGDPERTLSYSTIASLAKNLLIVADEQKQGERWKVWKLTPFGQEMVLDYKWWLKHPGETYGPHHGQAHAVEQGLLKERQNGNPTS